MDVSVTVSLTVLVGAVGVTVTTGLEVTLALAVLLAVRATVLDCTGFFEAPPSSVVQETRDFIELNRTKVQKV